MRCLSQLGGTVLAPAPHHPVRAVRFFERNKSNVVAVIECLAPTENGAAVLVELVVSRKGVENHITLEDISGIDREGCITMR